jgi:carbon storage regulator
MLVLNRRIGETVRIADDISVTVLGLKGQQVRLGFAASQSVPIHREEVYERIRREREATSPPSTAARRTAKVIVRSKRATPMYPSEGRE